MAVTGLGISVTGTAKVLAKLHKLQGKPLEKAVRDSLQKTSRKVLVPAVKAGAPKGQNSPWNRPGERYAKMKKKGGPLAKKVTVRTIRKRPGEFVAVSTKPRTWYTHFVIRGTRPHVITVRGPGGP